MARTDGKKIAVIGAGFGGLSAAIRLAHAGYEVTVYDRQEHIGGKAGSIREGGYRFDTGPSLVTMREIFAQLFEEVGRRLEDYIDFVPLDPICSYFFDDGSRLAARGQPEDFALEVEAAAEDSAQTVLSYLDYSRGIYEKTSELFLWNSLHRLSTYLKPAVWKGVFSRGRLDAQRSMDAANRSFFRDPRLVQLFDRYATYNGSDPYQVPATLNIIPHVEYAMGSYAIAGGIAAVPEAMGRLARELGVEFRLGPKEGRVDRILRGDEKKGRGAGSNRDGSVNGVRLAEGREIPADIVISNVDARRTYEDLLDDPEAPYARRYAALEPSSSGLVFFWGMKKENPELTVNNIFFSGDYPAEFRALFRELRVPADPTVYVNITSKVSSPDAPKGGENWFVLVNAPRNSGQDWDEVVRSVRPVVLRRIEKALGRSVADDIEVEQVLTPDRIEAETGSFHGSLYGISSNTKTAAFLRHPARTRRYGNLYFCGGSVHPGGGMPLAILSGKITADIIRGKA